MELSRECVRVLVCVCEGCGLGVVFWEEGFVISGDFETR